MTLSTTSSPPQQQLHDELRDAQRKVAAEIERARRIQTDLLPAAAPRIDGVDLIHRIQFLGDMGGDYYDYLHFADGRLGIVCADVMGKGLAAALIMAMSRSLINTAIATQESPGAILAEVNDGLTRDLEGQRLPYFLTMALAIYDPHDRSVTIAGGGHNPVVLIGPDGLRKLPSLGPALGVRTDMKYAEERFAAQPGDLMALYTDGLTEARNPEGELYGPARLDSALLACHGSDASASLDSIWADVAAFRGATPPSDDATLLIGRFE